MSKEKPRPRVKHCPFCGSAEIKFASGTYRCMACLAVFNASFNRYTRKPRRAPQEQTGEIA